MFSIGVSGVISCDGPMYFGVARAYLPLSTAVIMDKIVSNIKTVVTNRLPGAPTICGRIRLWDAATDILICQGTFVRRTRPK
jgi:hypothetical protein